MKLTWDEIVATMEIRRSDNHPLLKEMMEVRQRYNGDIVVPYAGDDRIEMPPVVPALISETIDNVSLRAASVLPVTDSPALDPGKQTGTKSREYASQRRDIYNGTWFASSMNLLLRRAFRQLAGYATTAFIVTPDYRRKLPKIEMRDPLSVYPEQRSAEDLCPPRNCGAMFERSAGWIRATYPEARVEYGGPVGPPGQDVEMWELVEWVDEDQVAVGIIGPRDTGCDSAKDAYKAGMPPHKLLRSWDNLAGRCTFVTPNRVTMDKIASQVAQVTGMVDLMAKIMALAIAAEERAVFPDRWVSAAPGQSPRIISNGGRWADGRTGDTNILDGVNQIGQLNSAPPQSIYQLGDRIERNVRVSTGLVPQFGGETYGALRTGRGIDAMMGVAVDPRVQELQEIMAVGLSHLNSIVCDSWKGYWGGEKITLFSGWGGRARQVEFVPNKVMETSENIVSYAIAGADIQSLTIQLGQLLGMNAISMRQFRAMHPWIGDPDGVGSEIDEETLERAALDAIMQQTATGTLPLTYLAKLEKARRDGNTDIFGAIEKANRELQEEQATPPPEAEEGLTAPPELMPGLQGGGMPPEVSAGPEIAPAEGSEGLRSLIGALRGGS